MQPTEAATNLPTYSSQNGLGGFDPNRIPLDSASCAKLGEQTFESLLQLTHKRRSESPADLLLCRSKNHQVLIELTPLSEREKLELSLGMLKALQARISANLGCPQNRRTHPRNPISVDPQLALEICYSVRQLDPSATLLSDQELVSTIKNSFRLYIQELTTLKTEQFSCSEFLSALIYLKQYSKLFAGEITPEELDRNFESEAWQIEAQVGITPSETWLIAQWNFEKSHYIRPYQILITDSNVVNAASSPKDTKQYQPTLKNLAEQVSSDLFQTTLIDWYEKSTITKDLASPNRNLELESATAKLLLASWSRGCILGELKNLVSRSPVLISSSKQPNAGFLAQDFSVLIQPLSELSPGQISFTSKELASAIYRSAMCCHNVLLASYLGGLFNNLYKSNSLQDTLIDLREVRVAPLNAEDRIGQQNEDPIKAHLAFLHQAFNEADSTLQPRAGREALIAIGFKFLSAGYASEFVKELRSLYLPESQIGSMLSKFLKSMIDTNSISIALSIQEKASAALSALLEYEKIYITRSDKLTDTELCNIYDLILAGFKGQSIIGLRSPTLTPPAHYPNIQDWIRFRLNTLLANGKTEDALALSQEYRLQSNVAYEAGYYWREMLELSIKAGQDINYSYLDRSAISLKNAIDAGFKRPHPREILEALGFCNPSPNNLSHHPEQLLTQLVRFLSLIELAKLKDPLYSDQPNDRAV
jgi:hypothetical protein